MSVQSSICSVQLRLITVKELLTWVCLEATEHFMIIPKERSLWYLQSNWIYICGDISSSLIVTVKYLMFSKCHVTVKNTNTSISVSIIVILKSQSKSRDFAASDTNVLLQGRNSLTYLRWKKYENWYCFSRYFFYQMLSKNLECLT